MDINSSAKSSDGKIQDNLKGLIESLTTSLTSNANEVGHSHYLSGSTTAKNTGQIPLSAIAATEASISESSDDSTIHSVGGYVADTSELQQHNNSVSPVKSPPTNQATPLTPTTNLKMLVAAASSALDRERRESEEANKGPLNEGEDSATSRKMKSLALLCKRFLQVADDEIGPGKEFSLEMMANSLGINRRRIYDIINVMEALEMISKQSKNWYMWHGRGNLLNTLAKLKAMVADDPDIAPYLENPDAGKPKDGNSNGKSVKTDNVVSDDHQAGPSKETGTCAEVVDEEDEQNYFNTADYPYAARSVRFDKSLGVLCQKFVMLFLISQDNEVTLEEAGRILVPDYQDDTIYMALNPPVNPKTKVRRLYDIANILTSLGLIEKKVFVGPLHVKKPGYSWSGPSIEEIDRVLNERKQENIKSVGRKTRKSLVVRSFLHHHDIQKESSSPLCSPVKTLGGTRFKRSLSFGGTTTSTPRPKMCSTPPISKQSTVLARPLCPKQVDYLREMKEFENEMNKHAHRYPNVASVFHEFLQKYQSTLEQTAAANGRFILPKAVSVTHGLTGQAPSLQQQQDVYLSHQLQPQKPTIVNSNTQPPQATLPTCNCGGMWEGGNVVREVDNPNLPPTPQSIACGHHSMQGNGNVSQAPIQVQGVQTPVGGDVPMGGPVVSDTLPCSNNFVASLANSILANILGTIQNSGNTEPPPLPLPPVASTQSQQQQPATTVQHQPLQLQPSSSISSASNGMPQQQSSHKAVVSNTVTVSTSSPLNEVQNNLKEKGTVLPVGSIQKEGFIHVDELLNRPSSRGKLPCGTNGVNAGPLVHAQRLTIHDSENCGKLTNVLATLNPNAFLTTDELGSNKENLSAYKYDGGSVVATGSYQQPSERSPKRQRVN